MTDKQQSLHLIQRMAQRLGEKSGRVAKSPDVRETNGFADNGAQPANGHTNGLKLEATISPSVSPVQVHAAQPQRRLEEVGGDNGRTVRLDLSHMHRLGLVTPDNLTSVLSNEYRSIKRKILHKARDPQTRATVKNLVMITSALPKEGKTFTAVNLAMSLSAERGLSVLLIDGDVVRPSVGAIFKHAPDMGLLDVLSGKVRSAREVTFRCGDVPNLSIILSGRPTPNSPELVSSARMLDLCAELAAVPDRIVIIDTPPVMGAPEAAALAPNMHQVIVVVASDQADRHQLRRTLDSVSTCRSISLLFNMAPSWHEVDYSPYYYSAKGPGDQKRSSGA